MVSSAGPAKYPPDQLAARKPSPSFILLSVIFHVPDATILRRASCFQLDALLNSAHPEKNCEELH